MTSTVIWKCSNSILLLFGCTHTQYFNTEIAQGRKQYLPSLSGRKLVIPLLSFFPTGYRTTYATKLVLTAVSTTVNSFVLILWTNPFRVPKALQPWDLRVCWICILAGSVRSELRTWHNSPKLKSRFFRAWGWGILDYLPVAANFTTKHE